MLLGTFLMLGEGYRGAFRAHFHANPPFSTFSTIFGIPLSKIGAVHCSAEAAILLFDKPVRFCLAWFVRNLALPNLFRNICFMLLRFSTISVASRFAPRCCGCVGTAHNQLFKRWKTLLATTLCEPCSKQPVSAGRLS